MKLKTLKEIEVCASQEIFIDLAKQEAIKWCKSYKETMSSEGCLKANMIYYEGCIGALKIFHNLTEEDLE